MPKRDYYDDPAAPKANSIVVAVTAAVRNPSGELLLIERTDNGLWALPGGAQDLGESVVEAAQREVREETGIDVEITGLSGIYSDPRHVIAYDNGEVRQEFSALLPRKAGRRGTALQLRVARSALDLARFPARPQNPSIHAAPHNPCPKAGIAAIPRLVGQYPGQAVFRTLNSGQQFRRPIGNEPGHDMARPVPLLDLGDSIRRADRTAIRGSRQIAVPQGIAECPALVREDGHQVADPAKLASKIALECRRPGSRHGQGTQASEVARAVQRMEACLDTGCVPDVMQPCRRDQDVAAQRQRRRTRSALPARPAHAPIFGAVLPPGEPAPSLEPHSP